MSELHVEIARIESISDHENADRLSIAKVYGWYCITSKVPAGIKLVPAGEVFNIDSNNIVYEHAYKPGDVCIYIPPDSVLSGKFLTYFFEGSKLKPDSLERHRLRTVKIRKSISQGAIIGLTPELLELFPELKDKKPGDDVAEILGITKWEPPASSVPRNMQGKVVKKKHPDFKEYTDIENIKWYGRCFQDGEAVFITEKLHGTSARFGLLPTYCRTKWQKLLKFLHVLPEHQFCCGSRRVQLDLKKDTDDLWYAKRHVSAKRTLQNLKKGVFKLAWVGQEGEQAVGNIYERFVKDLKSKIKPGEVLYGEIVGHGVQKGYTYGCQPGEFKFFAYDISQDGKYLDTADFLRICHNRDIDYVPVLKEDGTAASYSEVSTALGVEGYVGFNSLCLKFSEDLVNKLKVGDSTVSGQKVREGVVVKPEKDRNSPACGRLALKAINEEYLLKDQSEFH